MTDFTKIMWAGEECILVTIREHSREPVLILTRVEVERLNKVWLEKQVGERK